MEIKSLKKHTTSDYSHFHLLHKKYTFCGFQLEFVSIGQVINHMTCYNLSALIGEKFIQKNPLQDLLSSLNAIFSTNESTTILKGHVIYNPAYTYKDQLKNTFPPSFQASET